MIRRKLSRPATEVQREGLGCSQTNLPIAIPMGTRKEPTKGSHLLILHLQISLDYRNKYLLPKTLMQIKAIILDLDQTLLHTLHRFHAVFSEMVGGLSWEDFVELFREDRLDDLIEGDRARFWEEFTKRFSEARHPEDRPIKGAGEVLKHLSKKYRIVVTTGRRVPPEEVWRELEEFGLSSYVHEVRTLEGHDGVWHRDALLRRILEDQGLSPDEVVFVGDYWVDMDSARRAGIKAIAVRTGLEPDERLLTHGALIIIDGIWELAEALERHLKG